MRKYLTILLVIAIFLVLTVMNFDASADKDYSTIRVKVSINRSTVEITTKGDYFIPEKPGLFLAPGNYTLQKTSKEEVHIKGNHIDEKVKSGLTLVPREPDYTVTVKGTDHGTIDYLGQMQFVSTTGNLQVINHVPFEQYLYGVVAYEMNNNYPLEALKAQAVTARGYAAKRINGRGAYDVVDTTVHQVYKGYNPNHNRAIQAVDETKGQVLQYQDEIIDTYYAASNGGQTELPGNTWGGGSKKNADYPYLAQKDDPYDLRNPSSLIETFFVPKEITSDYGMYDQEEVVRITTGEGFQLNVRSGPGTSYSSLGKVSRDTRLPYISTSGDWYKVWYHNGSERTEGYVHQDYAVRETTDEDLRYQYFSPVLREMQATAFELLDQQGVKVEEKYDIKLTSIPSLTNGKERYPGTGSRSYVTANATVELQYYIVDKDSTENDSTENDSTEEGALSDKKEVSLELVLMRQSSTGSYLLGHPYLNGNLRMRSVESSDGGYQLVNGRYGHGVGMSQRGAQQMATEGKKHSEILAFYFEGTEMVTLDTESSTLPEPPEDEGEDEENGENDNPDEDGEDGEENEEDEEEKEDGAEDSEDDSEQETPTVTSEVYTIEEDIITGISPKTSLETFLKEISTNVGTLKILDGEGEDKTSGNIATGDVIRVYKEDSEELHEEHRVIIYGDISGDGIITTRDLLLMRRQLLELDKLKEPYATAADIAKTGTVNTFDLLMLRRHLLELEEITQ